MEIPEPGGEAEAPPWTLETEDDPIERYAVTLQLTWAFPYAGTVPALRRPSCIQSFFSRGKKRAQDGYPTHPALQDVSQKAHWDFTSRRSLWKFARLDY